ncbi:unnamed protein product [Cuscuta campestris]|uniref:Uncharacterized protein n=1 Tax=Cuscuta campestris TaxID=132261 RepID=A0A484KN95_9ASTE|nr:unnamed protein product [Cuscuta campestris]
MPGARAVDPRCSYLLRRHGDTSTPGSGLLIPNITTRISTASNLQPTGTHKMDPDPRKHVSSFSFNNDT